MGNKTSAVSLGSCIADLTCDKLQSQFGVNKLYAMYQWRTDQFLDTVVNKTSEFIPAQILQKLLADYLDPVKGADILLCQEKAAIDALLSNLAQAKIILLDNLMDLNIILYSGVDGCAPDTKVQIRHRYKDSAQLPFTLHCQPLLEETVTNNLKIIEFIKTVNSGISLWYLNYPFSPHRDGHQEKSERIQALAKAMWNASPLLKVVPCLDVPVGLQKDRWHFADIYYETLALFIMKVEKGLLDTGALSPIMPFEEFRRYVLTSIPLFKRIRATFSRMFNNHFCGH